MDMVEKVARAIADANMEDFEETPALHMELARAAIAAMREPTMKMIYDGNDGIDGDIDFWNYDSGSGYCVEPTAALNCWQRMIDAALTSTAPATPSSE